MREVTSHAEPTPTLFLDFDDVLCLNDPYGGWDVIDVVCDRHEEPHAVYASVFNPAARERLARIHAALDGQVRYVISSSWREAFDRDQLKGILRQSGLGFVAGALHEDWRTPVRRYSPRRVDEIAAWLDASHRGEPFAILDDLFSGHSLVPAREVTMHPMYGRVVLCREGEGLQDEHVEPLVQALTRPLVHPPQGASPP